MILYFSCKAVILFDYFVQFPGVLSYCMSKSAIDQFTECVALELAPKQVRVNSVK